MYDAKDPNGFNQLYAEHPDAQHIRVNGVCATCQRASLLSYQCDTMSMPTHHDLSKEYCMLFCVHCGVTTSGERDYRGLRKTLYLRRKAEATNLPEGKTCEDCWHFDRCQWLLSRISADERCDWIPIRFQEKL